MQVSFTRHARQRMVARGISEDDVLDALVSPDEIRSGDEGEEIAVRRLGNRELRVVYEATSSDQVVVITVMKPRTSGSKRGA
jgi:hypothetical protein